MVPANDIKQLREHRHNFGVAERTAYVPHNQALKIAAQSVAIHITACPTELQQDIRKLAGLLRGGGDHEPHEQVAVGLVHLANHAKINQADPPIRLDEYIAGVWIGMEETVLENHGQQESRRLV